MTGNRAATGATLEALMSKQDNIALVELSEQQLDHAAGGVHFTKTVDQASPNLFAQCCTGKHIPSAS